MSRGKSKLIHVAKIDNLRYDCNFVATNDEYVWQDTPNKKAVNAVYRNKEDLAKTIPFDYVEDVDWTGVRIEPGFKAYIKNTEQIKRGETPAEAVHYLDFDETYQLNRPPVTDSTSVEQQIEDILRNLTKSVHITTIPKYLNREKLDRDYDTQDIMSIMENMNESPIYQTRSGDKWWSIRQ